MGILGGGELIYFLLVFQNVYYVYMRFEVQGNSLTSHYLERWSKLWLKDILEQKYYQLLLHEQ